MAEFRPEYRPNSNKYKEEQKLAVTEKKVQKVTKGSIKVKKKSGARKLSEIFISDDVSNVKNYIFMDVLIPAAKKAVYDIVTNGISMALYGETGRKRDGSNKVAKVSYDRFYKEDRFSEPRRSDPRDIFNYDVITFTNRGDAELVLEQMDELIDQYKYVSVADFYDLAGYSINGNYTANNYGWQDLHNARIVPTRDGFVIKLPRAVPFD